MPFIQPLPKSTTLDHGFAIPLIGALDAPANEGISDFLPLVRGMHGADVEGYEVSLVAELGVLPLGEEGGGEEGKKFLVFLAPEIARLALHVGAEMDGVFCPYVPCGGRTGR